MGFFSIVKAGPFKTSKQILKTQFLKVVPFKVMISHHLKGSHLKNHKKNKVFNGPTLTIIKIQVFKIPAWDILKNPSSQGSES